MARNNEANFTFPNLTPQLIVAPNFDQARRFCEKMGWNPRYVEVAISPKYLDVFYTLKGWEVWFLDGEWPCRTYEQVRIRGIMEKKLRRLDADIRHWWA